MDVIATRCYFLSCTHHITLSDEFKQTIPDKITFRCNLRSQDLELILWNHYCHSTCKSMNDGIGENNTIDYTFKKWN